MLEYFRNAAKGWVAKILLGVLVLSFAVWGTNDMLSGSGTQGIAEVGSQTVTADEFQRELNRQVQLFSEQYGRRITMEEARSLNIPEQVRQQLIATAAFTEKARSLGLHVSQESIAQDIASSPQLRSGDGTFDQTTFRRYLEANGLSEAAFFQIEKRQREIAVLGSAATSLSIPKTLTQALDTFKNETRTARYFTISADGTAVPAPTDAELKTHYEKSPDAYTAPEFRGVALMVATSADVADTISVSEEELVTGYERLKTTFETPERRSYLQLGFASKADADKALVQLRAGEDFEKVATGLGFKPQDITFAGKTQRDVLDKALGEALFKLAPNTVSDPIQGSLTTAIVKVTAVEPGKKPTLPEVKDELRKKLQLEKAATELQVLFDQVEEQRSQQMKFEDIASKLKIRFTAIPALSAAGEDRAGAKVELPPSDELLRAVFALDPGVEAVAINLNDGFVWYEVREVTPPALKPLADVKDQVTDSWKAEKTRGLVEDKAKAIVAKIQSGIAFDTVAQENSAAVKEVTDLRRQQRRADFDGLALIALFGIPEKSATWALDEGGKSAKIILADKINVPAATGASAELAEQRRAFTSDLQSALSQAIRSSLTVELNATEWERISQASNIQ
jgi:peptidyl-prolyl cis-trans isomerase D